MGTIQNCINETFVGRQAKQGISEFCSVGRTKCWNWSINLDNNYLPKNLLKLWIYEIHIFELRNLCSCEKEAWKNQACRDSNPDLCDTGAVQFSPICFFCFGVFQFVFFVRLFVVVLSFSFLLYLFCFVLFWA